jgi:cell division protein FtsQ
MAAKRRISIRKILQAFVTLVVTSGCIVAVLAASRKQQVQTLNKIDLYVTNGGSYQFLDKQELFNDIVTKKGIKEHKTALSRLDVKAVEAAAYKNQWVSKAQAYVDNKRNLHINVTQRVPVARIFYTNGQSLYLDTSLRLLPLSDMFTHYTTIVTNVPVGQSDSANKSLRSKIIRLVRFIERDTFWSSQIDQVVVTEDAKFELIPVLGTHKILLGDTVNLKEKFGNLFAFYKNVLNKIGWEKYEIVDIRFKDQVVASPSLPWKAPSRNAISNMDWLKSILGEAAKDAPKVAATPPAKAPVAIAKPMAKVVDVKKDSKKATIKQEDNKQEKGKYIFHGNKKN